MLHEGCISGIKNWWSQRDTGLVRGDLSTLLSSFSKILQTSFSGLARSLAAQRRLGCGKAGNRHPIGRARHVIETRLLAEVDRGRIAAMLAADPELDAVAGALAALRRLVAGMSELVTAAG